MPVAGCCDCYDRFIASEQMRDNNQHGQDNMLKLVFSIIFATVFHSTFFFLSESNLKQASEKCKNPAYPECEAAISKKTMHFSLWPFIGVIRLTSSDCFLSPCILDVGKGVPETPTLHISHVCRTTMVQKKIMQITIWYSVFLHPVCTVCGQVCTQQHLRGAWLAYSCQLVGMWVKQMKFVFCLDECVLIANTKGNACGRAQNCDTFMVIV